MKIILYANKQVGLIALLTLKTFLDVKLKLITHDNNLKKVAKEIYVPLIEYKDLVEEDFKILVCCHGRKIIPKEILDTGTKYVTNEELIGPMRLINLINIT